MRLREGGSIVAEGRRESEKDENDSVGGEWKEDGERRKRNENNNQPNVPRHE